MEENKLTENILPYNFCGTKDYIHFFLHFFFIEFGINRSLLFISLQQNIFSASLIKTVSVLEKKATHLTVKKN